MARFLLVVALLASVSSALTPEQLQAYSSPTRVTDEVLKARANQGLGKVRRATKPSGTPPVYCGTDGEVVDGSGLTLPIPSTGSCSFPGTGCVQYTCYGEDSINGGVEVCGFQGTGGDEASQITQCSEIRNRAQTIQTQCVSSASILSFIGGTYASKGDSLGFGYNVTIGNFGTCNSPKYGGGKAT